MSPQPPKVSKDHRKWIKAFMGVDVNQKPYQQAEGPLGAMRPAGDSKQAKAFEAQFKGQLAKMDADLKFLQEHGTSKDYAAQGHNRDLAIAAYNGGQMMVDPADEARGEKFINEAKQQITELSNEIENTRQSVEKLYKEWTSRESALEEAEEHVGEMEEWGYKTAPDLHKQLTGVLASAGDRDYEQACAALDQAVPNIDTAYADYTQQKQAQEKYDAASGALHTRLQAAAASEFKTLDADRKNLADAETAMEGKASEKDYVLALEMQGKLNEDVTAFETKLSELKAKRDKFETARTDIQAEMKKHPNDAYNTTKAMRTDIATANTEMETAGVAEDYDTALNSANALKPMVTTYNEQVEALDTDRAAFEAAANTDKPKVDDYDKNHAQSKYKQMEQYQQSIEDHRHEISAAVEAEDFKTALAHEGELAAALDAYNKAYHDFEAAKKSFDDRRPALQKKLDTVGKPPHPKLHDEEQSITEATKTMDAAAAAADYEKATQMMTDLDGRADGYAQSVKDLEAAKQSYTDTLARVKDRADDDYKNSLSGDGTYPQTITDGLDSAAKSAETEDYKTAIDTLTQLEKDIIAVEPIIPDADVEKGITAIITRAKGYFDKHEADVTAAMDAFKSAAVKQIETLEEGDFDWTPFIGPVISAVSGALAVAFPPAAGLIVAGTFVANVAGAGVISKVQADAQSAKQTVRRAVDETARSVINGAHVAFDTQKSALEPKLRDMARKDKLVRKRLGEQKNTYLDQILHSLGIEDPSKSSLYSSILKGTLNKFSGWLAQTKHLQGKTGHDRMVAETEGTEDNKALKSTVKAAQQSADADADKLSEDRRKGR